MKIGIVYSSNTGNTKQVAQAIGESLNVEALPMEQVEDTSGFDVLCVGYWVDRATCNKEAKAFLSTIHGKDVFLFGTMGASPTSEHGRKALEGANACLPEDNRLLGSFLCQGKINPKIVEMFKKGPVHPANVHAPTEERMKLWAASTSHPDADDLAKAVQAVKQALSL